MQNLSSFLNFIWIMHLLCKSFSLSAIQTKKRWKSWNHTSYNLYFEQESLSKNFDNYLHDYGLFHWFWVMSIASKKKFLAFQQHMWNSNISCLWPWTQPCSPWAKKVDPRGVASHLGLIFFLKRKKRRADYINFCALNWVLTHQISHNSISIVSCMENILLNFVTITCS